MKKRNSDARAHESGHIRSSHVAGHSGSGSLPKDGQPMVVSPGPARECEPPRGTDEPPKKRPSAAIMRSTRPIGICLRSTHSSSPPQREQPRRVIPHGRAVSNRSPTARSAFEASPRSGRVIQRDERRSQFEVSHPQVDHARAFAESTRRFFACEVEGVRQGTEVRVASRAPTTCSEPPA